MDDRLNSTLHKAGLVLLAEASCPIASGEVGFWLDASDGLMKRRNADGTDVALGTLKNFYDPVRVATSAALPQSATYSTTTLAWTAGSNAALTLDGKTMNNGERFLRFVGDANDGIYVVTDKGASGGGGHPWVATRAPDMNATAEFVNGALLNVYDGTFASAEFQLTIPSPFVMDTQTPVFVTETIVQRMLTGQGHNGTGVATLTGAKVGDKVVGVSNVTDHVTASASFETTITVADQIQQSSASDLSAKTIIVLLNAKLA